MELTIYLIDKNDMPVIKCKHIKGNNQGLNLFFSSHEDLANAVRVITRVGLKCKTVPKSSLTGIQLELAFSDKYNYSFQ